MMKIQITKTDDIVTLDGVECRRWSGVTEGGVECDIFVHRIKVIAEQSSQFDAELILDFMLNPCNCRFAFKHDFDDEMPIPSGGI